MTTTILLALALYLYSKGAFGGSTSSNLFTAPAKTIKPKKGQTGIFIAPKGSREDNFFATLARRGHNVAAPVPEQAEGLYRVVVTFKSADVITVPTGVILAQLR